MKAEKSRWLYVHFLTVALIGVVIGRLLFSDSDRIRDLETRLAEASRSKNAPPEQSVPRSKPAGNSLSSPSQVGSGIDPDGILTDEERSLTEALIDRLRSGEYILHYEFPEAKKRMQAAFERMVAARAARDAQEYGAFFQELGLDPKMGQNLIKHVEKIHRAALDAEAGIQQVLFARRDYKRQIESQLSEEKLRKYESFERLRSGRQEVDEIRAFAQKNSIPFDPSWEVPLTEAVAKAEISTQPRGYGPLDAMPEYTTDRDAVIKQIENSIQAVVRGHQKAAEGVLAAGLPKESQQLLTKYLADRITEKRQTIERILHPHPRSRD
jgi:hypothetical protein